MLAVADMYEALAARRPCRQELSGGEVMDILSRQAGTRVCPAALAALRSFLATARYTPFDFAKAA